MPHAATLAANPAAQALPLLAALARGRRPRCASACDTGGALDGGGRGREARPADDRRAWCRTQGAMCLLDEVLQADARQHPRAAPSAIATPANPLRDGGVLPALCGIEYAAQAMAVHGACGIGQTSALRGMLAGACATSRWRSSAWTTIAETC